MLTSYHGARHIENSGGISVNNGSAPAAKISESMTA